LEGTERENIGHISISKFLCCSAAYGMGLHGILLYGADTIISWYPHIN
jgi:hypothetical protein